MKRATFIPQCCPVMERTDDGRPVGRCWFHMADGKTCPRHGDIDLLPDDDTPRAAPPQKPGGQR